VSDSPRVWIRGQRLLTVGMVMLITIAASESLAISTVMPLVEQELGDLPLYGWVFSAFFLGNVVGIIAAGHLADRYRPVLPLALGLALFVLGLVLGASAGSLLVLVGARAIQGIGAGAIPAVANVCVARAYSAAARPRMFALFSTAWIVPALVGPGLAGFVGQQLGWRWVFSALVPLALAAGAVTLAAVRRIPVGGEGGAASARVGWTLGLVVGSALFLTGLEAQPRWLGAGLAVVGAGLAGRALGVLWPAGTGRVRRGLPACVASKGFFAIAFFATDAFVPLALTDLRGVTVTYAGLVVTAVSLAWSAAAWVQERFVRTVGPRPLVRIGFALVAVGTGLFAIVALTSVPVALSFVAWSTAGAGAGLLFAPITAAGLAASAVGQEGAATSAMLLADTLGIAAGTGVAGAIVAAAHGVGSGMDAGLAGVFVLSVVFGLAGVWAARRLPASVLV
jgi:MFS family permease